MDTLRLISLIIYCIFYFGDGDATKISISSSKPKPGCTDGWVSFGESCYLFGDKPAAFFEAGIVCRNHGGTLVVIESKIENEFLKNQLKRMKDGLYRIGINNINTRGKVGWLFGFDENTPLSTFTDFQPDVSVKNGTNVCGVFSPGHSYQWDFEVCDKEFKPICEKKPTPFPQCVCVPLE